MQVTNTKFLLKQLQKVSFSIRNLKRSTIKEYYIKEETKRKNVNSNYEKNPTKTLNKIESNFLPLVNCDLKKFFLWSHFYYKIR